MSVVRVAFLGFGNVGRALYALLVRRAETLQRDHGVECVVTGVGSRRIGWRAAAAGLDPVQPGGAACRDLRDWLATSRADVVFEAMPLEPHTGQPALDYLRVALERGAHVVSANKGPLVHGYRELTRLAAARGLVYRFESAVMDGAPVFSLFRECLPASGLTAVRGVFTSTATVVLEAVERGLTFEAGIAEAQRSGIAEADPSYDVDGWDTAVKLCAVGNVLLGGELRPGAVLRSGLRTLGEEEIRRAAGAGAPYRLVGEVYVGADGVVRAKAEPVRCRADEGFGVVRGTTLVMTYQADVFPGGLTVTSRDPDPTTTAYGMLADMLSIVRGS